MKKKPVSASNIKAAPAIFDYILLAGLAVFLFYPPLVRGMFFPPEQQKGLIFAGILTLYWLALQAIKKGWRLSLQPMDYLALGLVAIYVISIAWAASPRLAVDGALKMCMYFMVYWLVCQVGQDAPRRSIFIHSIYLSGITVALVGFLSAIGIIELLGSFEAKRISSTMQYPNTLASFLGAISFYGWALWAEGRGYWRIPYAIGNYLLLLILVATNSRGEFLIYPVVLVLFLAGVPKERIISLLYHILVTILSVFIGAFKFIPAITHGNGRDAWLWLLAGIFITVLLHILYEVGYQIYGKKGQKRVAGGFMVMVLVALTGVGLVHNSIGDQQTAVWSKMLPEQFVQRVQTIDLQERNSAERLYWMQDAGKMIKDRPWVGLGGGGWEAAYKKYQGYNYNSTQVHNDWLQIWLEVGTVGFILYTGIWFLFLFIGWQIRRKGNLKDQLWAWSTLSAGLGIGMHALIDFDLSLSAVSILLWTLFGLIRAQDGIKSADNAQDELASKAKEQIKPGIIAVLPPAITVLILMTLAIRLLIADGHVDRAIKAFQSGDGPQAAAHFEKAVQLDPFSATIRMDLAKIYQQMGRTAEADKYVKKALQQEKYNYLIAISASEYHFNLGDAEAGLAMVERAVSLAPRVEDMWERLAWAYAASGTNVLASGDKHQGENYFKEAVKIQDRINYMKSNLTDREKNLWRQWEKFGSSPKIALALGISHYFLGDFTVAEVHLLNASKSKEYQGDAYLWLGLLREKQGHLAEADKLYKMADGAGVRLSPGLETLREIPLLK